MDKISWSDYYFRCLRLTSCMRPTIAIALTEVAKKAGTKPACPVFELRTIVLEDEKLNFRIILSNLLMTAVCLLALVVLSSTATARPQDDPLAELEALTPDDVGGGQTTTAQGDSLFDSTESLVPIEFSENTRNQGFVGATAPGISTGADTGFVGAASEDSGPPLSDGASFGGGVNDVSPTVPSSASGESNSFTVIRKSIRAKLRTNFYAPETPGTVVSSRFQNHFSRQPGSQFSGSQYTVTVSDRTAYINGTVNTAADSERLERQLRLEPGVYRIVNQLSYPGSFEQAGNLIN